MVYLVRTLYVTFDRFMKLIWPVNIYLQGNLIFQINIGGSLTVYRLSRCAKYNNVHITPYVPLKPFSPHVQQYVIQIACLWYN